MKPLHSTISRKSGRTKALVISGIVVLVISGLILLYLEKTRVTDLVKDPTSSNSDAKQSETQKQAELEEKRNFIENSSDSQQTPAASDLTMTVTASQASNTVTVVANIQNAPSGSCTLTVSVGSKSISKQAAVIYQPEFSSCAGFSIPVDEIGAGSWSIKLSVTTPDGEGSTSTTLEVK